MHPSPALVPRLSALVRAKVRPPPVRLSIEHAETHAPMAVVRDRTGAAATAYPHRSTHPHPLSPHTHANHPFRQPRKYLFFTTDRRTEPLPAPMISWNDHLSMV